LIVTTTHNIENYSIERYIGLVTGEIVLGTNFMKDWVASIKDVVGGQIGSYQNLLMEGAKKAIAIMVKRAQNTGANAIIAVDFDYGVIAPKGVGTVLMIAVNGTAVYVVQNNTGK
jgi:uncharacterized protein YbjQ (UPF0145 family)